MVGPNGSEQPLESGEPEFRAAVDVLLERLRFMRQAGITFNDARDLYEILGYARILTVRDYRDRYARGGIAGRIIDALPNATWRGTFELIEDEKPKVDTAFEKAWKDLDQRLQIQARLLRVDKLAGQSTYAVLLIGAPGNLEDELPRGNEKQLLYLQPFLGGGGPGGDQTSRDAALDADCTIGAYDVDPRSARFGLPLFYRLKRTDLSTPMLARQVHWSRVIHIAENCLSDDVYGLPRLERVWNLLDDLEKVTGGGAEAFWLRANQGTHVDIDKDMALAEAKDTVPALHEQLEKYQHNLTRWIRTRGVKIEQLGSDVANFSNPADAVLTQIAGAIGIPKRILTGSEMGELASSQDRDNWKDQINGRQKSYAGPYIVRQLVDRLIAYGYLPTPAKGPQVYDVRWPHVEVLTEDEKAAGALKWAEVNKTAGFIVFTDDEIRDHWYQMEPEEPDVTEAWRADLAVKMATANKTEGAIVFTDDEIRKTAYDWPPLTPEKKIPVTAPERVTATAPTPVEDQVGGKGTPPKAPPALVAAEETELLQVLEDAIREGNVDVVARLVGARHD